MKIEKNKIAWLAFLILSFSLVTHGQNETPPTPGEPRAATIPTPLEKTLSNGLRVIVIERKNVPLVTASLLIKSGGEVDPQNLAGAADMTAELLTKGTKNRSAPQIAEQMEFLGGSIISNAAWDYSNVVWRVMPDKMDSATAIAADTIKNPVFAQEEVDRLKIQTLDELSVTLKQPGALANYVANRVVFGEETYGHPLGGTPESLNKITRQDLVQIHSTYYSPNNAILVVAGDIVAGNAFALAEKYFGDWAKKVLPKDKPKNEKNSGLKSKDSSAITKITVIDLPNSGQAAVSVAQRGTNRLDRSYYESSVANSVLGGGYSARLNQEIRIKRGLSYGANSGFVARLYGGIFSSRTQTKNESAGEVAEIIVNELNRLAAQPIAASELTPRKAVLIGNFSRDLETTGGLVNQIAQLALYGLQLGEINNYIQKIEKVSDMDARAAVQKLFGLSDANIIIVGDANKFMPDLQKRFSKTKIEIIPATELNLNNATLRTVK